MCARSPAWRRPRSACTLPILTRPVRLPSTLEQLAQIPEEEIWPQKQKSARGPLCIPSEEAALAAWSERAAGSHEGP